MILFSGIAFADASFRFNPGWNLAPVNLFQSVGCADSENAKANISAIYLYSPLDKSYVGAGIGGEGTQVEALGRKYTPYALSHLTPTETGTSFWVYWKGNPCTTSINTGSSYQELSTKKLFAGWNFMSIVPWMEGKNLNDMLGSCNVQRLATWSSESQSWSTSAGITPEKLQAANTTFSNADIGKTLLVKTAAECSLSATGQIPPAPALPDDDSPASTAKPAPKCTDSDGKDYSVKGTAKGSYGGPGNIVGGEEKCFLRSSPVESCTSLEEKCELVEYYCQNDYLASEQYKCPKGCKDGACIA